MGDLEVFIENIKNSFAKVKSHIEKLEREIELNKKRIIEQNMEIMDLKERVGYNLASEGKKRGEIEDLKRSSTGNKGVVSLTHSLRSHSLTHINGHKSIQINTKSGKNLQKVVDLKKEIKKLFSTIQNKEFLIFLTIYQLEEELNNKVSYLDISGRLKLSEDGIRSYISRIMKKGLPLKRHKVNNKLSLFQVDPQFRALNLKKDLMDMYFKRDPNQSRLDKF